MENEHEFVRKNMERIKLELNNTMTIFDFVNSKKASNEVSEMIKDIPKDYIPSKEELYELAIELLKDTALIYDKGFNDALELISKCDSTILKRKCPPHLLS